MAPPLEPFPLSELEARINTLPNGRRRKGGDIDLRKCELLELVQYECGLKGSQKDRQAIIQCAPVVKLFRRWAPSWSRYYMFLTLTGLQVHRRTFGGNNSLGRGEFELTLEEGTSNYVGKSSILLHDSHNTNRLHRQITGTKAV